jgi:hypothetical protein
MRGCCKTPNPAFDLVADRMQAASLESISYFYSTNSALTDRTPGLMRGDGGKAIVYVSLSSRNGVWFDAGYLTRICAGPDGSTEGEAAAHAPRRSDRNR